jgi:hypothetical protein
LKRISPAIVGMLTAVCLGLVSGRARGVDTTWAWTYPTNNENGTPVTDLIGTRFKLFTLSEVYQYSNVVSLVAGRRVTNSVVAAWTIVPAAVPVKTVLAPALTNAPVGVVTDAVTIVGVPEGPYLYEVRAVDAYANESAAVTGCVVIGKPDRIKLVGVPTP